MIQFGKQFAWILIKKKCGILIRQSMVNYVTCQTKKLENIYLIGFVVTVIVILLFMRFTN